MEAAGILMEKREEVIGDCRAVMEALADCGSIDTEMEAVSSEMEVTAGLIQKLVDENATRNLTSTITAKSMTGMPAGTPPLRAGWTAWKKSGRGRKSSMTFSAASLRGLARRGNCRWTSMRSCFTGLWITQRSIRTAGWFSPSVTEWKSARRFKAGNGRGIGFAPDASGRFFCAWK